MNTTDFFLKPGFNYTTITFELIVSGDNWCSLEAFANMISLNAAFRRFTDYCTLRKHVVMSKDGTLANSPLIAHHDERSGRTTGEAEENSITRRVLELERHEWDAII